MSPGVIENPHPGSTDTGRQLPAADSPVEHPVTVVLADDHKVIRSGLRVLLESDKRFTVLAEAGDVTEAVENVYAHHPQVLVLDLNMGGDSSLDSIPQLRAQSPDTQIVVLTMQDDPAFARAALSSGALGYVLKDAASDELMNAVLLAAAGQNYVNPQLGARLAVTPAQPEPRPDKLSPRETEVLKLIASGHTNTEIAASLYISVRTVESHRAHIQQKIEPSTRAELFGYARTHGLLE